MNLEARERVILRFFPDAVAGRFANSEKVFFVTCPGLSKHENDTGPKHTAIRYTGPTITIVCQHRSCRYEPLVLEVQRAMRLQLCGELDENKREVMNRPSVKDRQKLDFSRKSAERVFNLLDNIFVEYRDESFLDKKLGLEESRERYFSLYKPDHIIWLGKEYDSGAFRGGGHFRTVAEWKERTADGELYPFTTTSIYFPGVYSRSADSVREQLFRVLEFDTLIADPQQNQTENQLRGWALFQYLRKNYGLQLKLVVHTGNKSPHFWVQNETRFNDMFLDFLKRVGVDPGCLRASQPVRFAGVMRNDAKVQNQPQCVIEV